jgi:hypothetical protein
MFIEIVTKRNEIAQINVNMIILVAPKKNGTYILDISGNEYEILESFVDFIARLNKIRYS